MTLSNPDEKMLEAVTPDEREFVLDVLEMHRALRASYAGLEDKDGIKATAVRFGGFDGDQERTLLLFARHYCEEVDQRRYEELGLPGTFATHSPRAAKYRAMLHEWKQAADPQKLTAADIRRIVGSRS
jgi:uncharacterized protein